MKAREQAMQILAVCASTPWITLSGAAYHLGVSSDSERLAGAAFRFVNSATWVVHPYAEAQSLLACGWEP